MHILLVSGSALLGVFVLATSTEGWIAGGPIAMPFRVVLFVCALMLIAPEYYSSIAGAVGFAAIWLYQRWRLRTAPAPAA